MHPFSLPSTTNFAKIRCTLLRSTNFIIRLRIIETSLRIRWRGETIFLAPRREDSVTRFVPRLRVDFCAYKKLNRTSFDRQEVMYIVSFGERTRERQQICEYILKLDRNLSNFSRSYRQADVIKPVITPGMKRLLLLTFSPFISTSCASVRKSKPGKGFLKTS